jgi:hypothetical protein
MRQLDLPPAPPRGAPIPRLTEKHHSPRITVLRVGEGGRQQLLIVIITIILLLGYHHTAWTTWNSKEEREARNITNIHTQCNVDCLSSSASHKQRTIILIKGRV